MTGSGGRPNERAQDMQDTQLLGYTPLLLKASMMKKVMRAQREILIKVKRRTAFRECNFNIKTSDDTFALFVSST